MLLTTLPFDVYLFQRLASGPPDGQEQLVSHRLLQTVYVNQLVGLHANLLAVDVG